MYLLRSKDPNSLEAELTAIHRIVRSLEPLRPEQRIKVLQYALTHLGLSLAVTENFETETPELIRESVPARH